MTNSRSCDPDCFRLNLWFNETVYEVIKRDGKVRVIIDISYQVIELVREMISIGEEVRHIDQHGIMFVAFEKKSL